MSSATSSLSPTRRSGRPARPWVGLVGFLVAVAAVAGIGGVAAGSAPSTYATYDLPPYAPPSWLFGPVWSVLYVLIGVAGWIVWRVSGWRPALTLWVVQLVLNLAWTPLFFGAGLVGWALVEIVVLWVAVLATIVAFRGVSRPAAWLLVPYLAWVTFATALNTGIWVLN